MRPLEPFRISNLVSVTVTPLLLKQAQHYAKTHDLKLAAVVRSAIQDFVHDPLRFKAPNIQAIIRSNPTLRLARGHSINLTLLPSDRQELDQLSQTTKLPNSALIRRAIYEYTKTDTPASLLPELLVDAWGDQPLAQMPQARPPEKRRKKKPAPTPAPTNALLVPPNKTNYVPNLTVDEDSFDKEFGQWLK